MATNQQTVTALRNIADSYAPGSPGRRLAEGQIDAFTRNRRIVDPVSFAPPEYDLLGDRARAKGVRRPSAAAMRQTRSFRRHGPVVWPWLLGGLAMALFAAMVIGESVGAVS